MNKQSKLAPLKVEIHADDRFGRPMKRMQTVTVCTHINKGRDKKFYDERRVASQKGAA